MRAGGVVVIENVDKLGCLVTTNGYVQDVVVRRVSHQYGLHYVGVELREPHDD